jgi:hypothetical protein
MADVPILVAAISASAGVLGAAVSPFGSAYLSSRKERRERRERHEADARQACIDLYRAAVEMRTQVANNHEYHGKEMGARLALVRRYAADAAVHAASIALLAPEKLADPAEQVALAADRLAAAAAANTDLALGVSKKAPDFRELNDCIANFRKQAVDYVGG